MSGKRRKETGPGPEAAAFHSALIQWYRNYARRLPWRDTTDPYCIWLSEIMLQQTRVAAVIEHYHEFLRRFPSLLALALAPEADVLAAWSGLGYYRRARMLHKAAQFITEERGGILPSTAAELRTLPGIGEYTSAAIASIAFGEHIAVVDGNVQRVLLRLTGRPEEPTAAARAFLRNTAQELMPALKSPRAGRVSTPSAKKHNIPAEHNQAMMELGATICLPRAPLCLECPVFALCKTRGEHRTPPRARLRSREVACLLSLRKRGIATEVLLARRPEEASLMPGMYELPPLPVDGEGMRLDEREPVLRLRHAITTTNYYVRVYAPRGPGDHALRNAVPLAKSALQWVKTAALGNLPLTGLTRKALQRLNVMAVQPLQEPAPQGDHHLPLRHRRSRELIVDFDEDHDAF
jgi:A/G-specific adenine glycosylase